VDNKLKEKNIKNKTINIKKKVNRMNVIFNIKTRVLLSSHKNRKIRY